MSEPPQDFVFDLVVDGRRQEVRATATLAAFAWLTGALARKGVAVESVRRGRHEEGEGPPGQYLG